LVGCTGSEVGHYGSRVCSLLSLPSPSPPPPLPPSYSLPSPSLLPPFSLPSLSLPLSLPLPPSLSLLPPQVGWLDWIRSRTLRVSRVFCTLPLPPVSLIPPPSSLPPTLFPSPSLSLPLTLSGWLAGLDPK
jgi:hypothetical protein